LQSGRNPIHVNVMNLDPTNYNPADQISGFSGIPRNMTGLGTVMKSGGYQTHFSGKWDTGMATLGTPHAAVHAVSGP
jgi:arylsulfatase I/J